ncbi:amino acid ABC transporter substrate-binding protein [Pusillimonas sp.]|uniref:amino acid ABC transporter substrate-binding protein n=1 Tax=Pusillimonas sp. TaxID=3040095 RepID=UPI0029AA4C72|nr:amino acid ABC transporter substrate-binding protein [Pusillimonas sp.]MDX3896180.1 amino acid ABC transporter substrate-binding protein [Pusillimonas sp.]
MNTKKKLFMAAMAALVVSVAGPSLAKAAEPVRLGFSIAKTGIFAAAAPSQLHSYEMWKDEVNAAGGLDIAGEGKRPVEFVVYDDQSNPGQAARIYEKLITQDKVDLLLAPWGTSIHAAIAPVLERFKFPMVGNSAASAKLRDLKPGYIWFVTAAFPDREAKALADMLKAQNYETVALLANVLPYSKELKKFLEPELKKHGIKILVNSEYPPDIKDMTVQLSQVKEAKPDAVISLSYPNDSALYVQQAKELGLPQKFHFVQIGPAMDFFTKLLGKSADGIVTMGHWSPNLNPLSREFNEAYTKKYGENPDYLDSAESYVSLQILQQAIAKAGLDKAKLRDAVSTGTFDTLFGSIKFTGVENLSTPTGLLQLQNGKPEIVWPTNLSASVPFQPKTGW